MHTLHRHDVGGTEIPVHLGHDEQPSVGKITSKLRRVGSFAHQVELVMQMLGKLGDNFTRFQASAVFREAFDELSESIEQINVVIDDTVHPGAQYFDSDIVTIVQASEMYLSDRRGGYRFGVEFAEGLGEWHSQTAFDLGHGQIRRERWDPILQFGQFVSEVGRQQIASR